MVLVVAEVIMSYRIVSIVEYEKLSIEEMQEVRDLRNQYLIATYGGHHIYAVIIGLAQQYLVEQEITDIAQINDGSCWDFADDLLHLFPEGVILHNQQFEDSDWDHCFFKLGDLYYDSEAPEGVADWRDLPCCRRCMA